MLLRHVEHRSGALDAAKSLVLYRFEVSTIASMPPPPDLDPRRGQTPYWAEAKRWAQQVWVAELLGQDAVDAALSKDAATRTAAPSVDANVTHKRRKKTAFDVLYDGAKHRYNRAAAQGCSVRASEKGGSEGHNKTRLATRPPRCYRAAPALCTPLLGPYHSPVVTASPASRLQRAWRLGAHPDGCYTVPGRSARIVGP